MNYVSSLPQGALSWESQIHQYQDAVKPAAPGITYYAGDVSGSHPGKPPVDCLLFWGMDNGLRILGILNHYPADYPPHEREGNVNIWVRRSHQRQGIASLLWQEAVNRWDVSLDDQRFTESGARWANAYAEQHHHDNEALGPCGCTDYHMADCPTRTGYADAMSRDEYDDQPEW